MSGGFCPVTLPDGIPKPSQTQHDSQSFHSFPSVGRTADKVVETNQIVVVSDGIRCHSPLATNLGRNLVITSVEFACLPLWFEVLTAQGGFMVSTPSKGLVTYYGEVRGGGLQNGRGGGM